MKAVFSSLLIVFAAPVSGGAFADKDKKDVSLEAHCEARGLRFPENEWAIIVEGSFAVDPREVADGQEHMPAVIEEAAKHPGSAVYVPVGVKSKIFGEPQGTRLQISFWRRINAHNQAFKGFALRGKKNRGLYEISGYQTLVVNGIPISAQLDMPGRRRPAHNRILLGHDRLDKPALVSAPSEEDLILQRESPVILPEGEFLFVYSDCRTKYTVKEAD